MSKNGNLLARAVRDNFRTNILPVNFCVADFIIMHSHRRPRHKLNSKWKGPIRVVGIRSHLVFEVKDLTCSKHIIGHAQPMVINRTISNIRTTLQEVQEQAEYLGSTFHILEVIKEKRMNEGAAEI